MKFLWLLLCVVALGVAKPAKRSVTGEQVANETTSANLTVSDAIESSQTNIENACPEDFQCVSEQACEVEARKTEFTCADGETCCDQTIVPLRRRRATPPAGQFRPVSLGFRPIRRPHPHPQQSPSPTKHPRPPGPIPRPPGHVPQPPSPPPKKPEEVFHYMDYYDPRYERIFGPTMSSYAKDLYSNYRHSEECGVRNEKPELMARVSTGYLHERGFASFGEFPWHVALLVRERVFTRPYSSRPREDVRYKCGGTLIDENFVITAAHCVFGERQNRLKIHLGEWNLDGTTGELFPAVERTISQIHIHTGFDPTTYVNDVALLRLSTPVDLAKTPHINPVCLTNAHFDHKKCFVVGWGDDVYKPNFGSNILRAVSVLFVSDLDVCRAKLFTSFKEKVLQSSFDLDKEQQKCIIGEFGKDACVGDGGGAVVCALTSSEKAVSCNQYKCADKHYFIAGIVSFGSPNCGEDSATVVTDIGTNLNWIKAITSQKLY